MNRSDLTNSESPRQDDVPKKHVSEFPTFSTWALAILKAFMVFVVLNFVGYPLLSQLLIWLGLDDVFHRIVQKARLRNNPTIILYTVYVVIACLVAYPFIAVGHCVWNRIGHRLTRKRRSIEKQKKKNRIV